MYNGVKGPLDEYSSARMIYMRLAISEEYWICCVYKMIKCFYVFMGYISW